MIRLASFVFGLVVLPVAALAQQPPTPPAPPAPMAAPAPSVAPLPPRPPVAVTAPAPMPAPMPFVSDFGNLHVDIDTQQFEMHVAQVAHDAAQMASTAAQDMKFNLATGVTMQTGRGEGYNAGLDALQRREYDRAITIFDRVVAARQGREDAALYWKAFAQFRSGQSTDALESLAALRRDYAKSRYLVDARVLEADVKQRSGQQVDPAQIDNDEIKLLAIQGLQRSEQVVPLLQQVLAATNTLNVKKRALYVLALSDDARARPVLLEYAKGSGSPDLQIEAIRYLASRRDLAATSPMLREVYAATSDASLKREVINAYVSLARTQPRPIAVVNGRPAPPAEPTTPASVQAVATELVAIYRLEGDAEVKRHVISALYSIGAVDQVLPLIRLEKDPQVQLRAISAMGGRRSDATTRALVGLYGELTDVAPREAVISVLAGHRDADTLISLARKETNPRLKTTLVRHISEMARQSEAAAAYLLEILK